MSLIRFFMLLSLVVWVGGIAFLAFILAPIAFHAGFLPSRHLAGSVVGQTLNVLHWTGVTCGIVFVATSMVESHVATGTVGAFAGRNLLVYLMIAFTLVSMFSVSTRMFALRNEMVVVDSVPLDDPRRVEFDRLHVWSTRIEGAVFLLGLAVIFLTGRRLS
ncbi:MAG TPA: DUF4149 domain-containing protein [Terriglobales bacterium]|nr:DUF4149 domain-containing protein [Terriglobales bacterium]